MKSNTDLKKRLGDVYTELKADLDDVKRTFILIHDVLPLNKSDNTGLISIDFSRCKKMHHNVTNYTASSNTGIIIK